MSQPECIVEFAGRIGKTRQIVQFIGCKEFGGAFFRAQVHEGETSAIGFQFTAKGRKLGDRLAAEGSAKMTEEYQQ